MDVLLRTSHWCFHESVSVCVSVCKAVCFFATELHTSTYFSGAFYLAWFCCLIFSSVDNPPAEKNVHPQGLTASQGSTGPLTLLPLPKIVRRCWCRRLPAANDFCGGFDWARLREHLHEGNVALVEETVRAGALRGASLTHCVPV